MSDFEGVEPLEMRAVVFCPRIYRSSKATSNVFESHLSEWGKLAAASMICEQKLAERTKKDARCAEMSTLTTQYFPRFLGM